MRQLCKGNVAVIKGAVLAGCRAYYGYPITPASEVAEGRARVHEATVPSPRLPDAQTGGGSPHQDLRASSGQLAQRC
jgi:hypothetical protein